MNANIKVNFSKKTGKRVQALHGFNSGPMTKVFTYDARPLFVEGGFPYVRLHDSEYPYGSGEFIDIPCIKTAQIIADRKANAFRSVIFLRKNGVFS